MSKQAWAWGYNDDNQLGDGSTTEKHTPTAVNNNLLTSARAIACGGRHSLAIDINGKVWAWGANYIGQLGDGSTTQRNSPTAVNNTLLTSARAIACGEYHSLAIDENGKLWAWGGNGEGQLGNGTTTSSNTPTPVNDDNLKQAIAIACGLYHSLAIDINGKVWAWGNNGDGELGVGDTDQRNVPTAVIPSFTIASAIACGGYHSLAIDENGKLWAWGRNSEGQAGISDYYSPIPTSVINTNLTAAIAINAGMFHSLAIDPNKKLWAWGSNDNGQLGDGSTSRRFSPTAVNDSLLTSAIAIACGAVFSLAIDTNKKVWAWGSNGNGQLGDGSTTQRNSPTAVNDDNLTYAAVIAGGSNFSLSIDADADPPPLTRGIRLF